MSIPSNNWLRKDLIVTTVIDRATSVKRYLIKDPSSQETFEFGEEEFFLCQCMDGVTPVSKILASFQERFNIKLTEADYQKFARQIASADLLELPEIALQPSQSSHENSHKGQGIPTLSSKKQSNYPQKFLWKHPNPDTIFSRLASWTKPVHRFSKLSTWLLLPLLPIALLTFWNNMTLFWHDVRIFVDGMPFIMTYLADILLLNLCGRAIQGTVFTAYGGHMTQFGLILALGFIPHFQFNLKEYQSVPRNAQLWIYATPLIMRLFIFSFGVILWSSTRQSGTALSIWVLIFAHTALITFLLMACPLWFVYDGYYFFVSAFRLPDNFISQSQKAWRMMLWGQRLPRFLSTKDKLILVGFGLGSTAFFLIMLFLLISYFSKGIATTFPGFLGPQTATFVLVALLIIGLRGPVSRLIFGGRNPQISGTPSVTELTEKTSIHRHSLKVSDQGFQSWLKKNVKFFILAGLVILLFLPYQTRPGGTLQLLTPKQIAIQAEVDGKSKITRVMFSGGNEQFIRAGTVIAQMEDIDLEDQIETLQSQIVKAESDLQGKQSYLDKLLATPRKEDVDVARNEVETARGEVEKAQKEVEVAIQNLEVIKTQIKSALTQADFYSREASRLETAYQEGVIALNQLEDTQRMVETNKIDAEEKRQSLLQQQKEVEQSRSQLATKQKDLETSKSHLKLVLSGSYPDDIKAARHEVDAARAELVGLKNEQQQARKKLKLTTLVMPLNGYLVTPYLETKVGSYLEQGDTFAEAEDATSIVGEVQVPEYDIGQFSMGKKVAVKLDAYAGEVITGKVIAITPSASDSTDVTASDQSLGRVVKVLVEIPYSGRILKTGMTGYAKIDGPTKPVIVAFTAPLVRFVQIEIWSWLP